MAGRPDLDQHLFVPGVATDADLIASAEDAFLAYDEEETNACISPDVQPAYVPLRTCVKKLL
jgi:hypothetical protein